MTFCLVFRPLPNTNKLYKHSGLEREPKVWNILSEMDFMCCIWLSGAEALAEGETQPIESFVLPTMLVSRLEHNLSVTSRLRRECAANPTEESHER